MVVLIMDLDWMFDKSELPNVNCTKLSSFHKQRGDNVYFVNDMSELRMLYDRLYVFGESDSLPALNSKIMNDEKTVLFGKRFALCGAKQLGKVVMSCRPDYLLYDIADDGHSSYKKANFVTFFTDSGERIPKLQEWKNTKKGIKRTIVTDTVLWRQKPEEVEECLEALKNEKNIVFLTPISIRYLITNEEVKEKFLHLNFSRGTKFKWRNDVGSDAESAQKICSFMLELKKHTKSNIGAVPIVPEEKGTQDNLERLLTTIAVFKENKIKCFLPRTGYTEHLPTIWIRDWCDKNIESSFIEEMIFFVSMSKGQRWYQIINNPRNWKDQRTRFLIKLLYEQKWQKLLPQMCIQWGTNSLNYSAIDLQVIEQNAYLIT